VLLNNIHEQSQVNHAHLLPPHVSKDSQLDKNMYIGFMINAGDEILRVSDIENKTAL